MSLPWLSRLESDDPNFTSLHVMSFRKLSETDWIAISTALAKNTKLLEFNTSGQRNMSPIAIKALASAVATRFIRGYPLNYLCFGDNSFGDDNLAVFCEQVKADLASNGSFCDLPAFLVKKLDLENKGISHVGLGYLANLLTDICVSESLTLARNAIFPCVKIGSFRSVTNLDLSGCDAQKLNISSLRDLLADSNSVLTSLIMWDCNLSQEHFELLLKAVACSKQLARFYISPLEKGKLSGTIDVMTLSALVDIRFKCVSFKSVSISKLLLSLSKLKHLEISHADLSEDSMRFCDDEFALALQVLDLSGNQLSGDSLLQLLSMSCLLNLKQMLLIGNKIETFKSEFRNLSPLSNLERLDISCNPVQLDLLDVLICSDVLALYPALKELVIGGVADSISCAKDKEIYEQRLVAAQDMLASRNVELIWKVGK